MRSNRILGALVVVACASAVVARIFHGQKPFADIAFLIFAVTAVAAIATVLHRVFSARRMLATVAILAVAATATAAIAATLPKTAWVARADAACQRIDARVAALPAPKVNPASPRRSDLPGVAHYLRKLHPLLAHEVAAVAALPTPDRDGLLVHGFIASMRASVAALGDSASAASRGDLAGYKHSFLRDERAGTRASALAKQLGMHVCAR